MTPKQARFGEDFPYWLKRGFAASRACGAAVPGMRPGGRSGRGRAEGGTGRQRPGQIPGRCPQLRLSSPSTALMTDGAGGRMAAVSPSPHLPAYSALRTRGAGLRTGIAAGHLPALFPLGQCADPRGRLPRASDPPLCPPLCRRTVRKANETTATYGSQVVRNQGGDRHQPEQSEESRAKTRGWGFESPRRLPHENWRPLVVAA